jgi:ParB family chromosome partitioning protein
MGKLKYNMSVKPLDELFGDGTESLDKASGRIISIELNRLRSFDEHPFKVRDDTDMAELTEIIEAEGVMNPIIVRAFGMDGGYQIISGHRRKRACELAGLTEIPAIVKELDDDGAIAFMVDTNLSRTKILPSEKAFAYKLKLDAMKRQAGRPIGNGTPVGYHLQSKKSVDILGEATGESREQIRRYIRLAELIPELLDRVDTDTVSVRAGVELSYIPIEGQRIIDEAIAEYETENSKLFSVSIKQAGGLRSVAEEQLDGEAVCRILFGLPKAANTPKLKLNTARIFGYFPDGTTSEEIEETIVELLERRRGEERELH